MMATRALGTLVLALIVMAGCGGGGGGSGTPDQPQPPLPPAPPPVLTAQVQFPPFGSATEASGIIVSGGAASSTQRVTAVNVNGIPATSGNDFQTWQVSVPLNPGQNTLAVEVVDAGGNRNAAAAQVSISRTAMLPQPSVLAVDAVGNRAIAFDGQTKSLAVIDLVSGLRTVLSSALANNGISGIRLVDVVGMVVDAANHRALVLDAGLFPTGFMGASTIPGIVAVDLNTGARTLFSGPSVPNGANSIQAPLDIALDAAHGRALVVDGDLNTVLAVSLADGSRSILSGPNTPDNIQPFASVFSIAVDTANNRALVLDGNAVIAVNLGNGARSLLSDGNTGANPFSSPFDIVVDAARNRALVSDSGLGALVAVSLVDGSRSIVTEGSGSAPANVFSPGDIAIDAARARALVASDQDSTHSALVAVDLTSGSRVVQADPSRQTDVPLGSPIDVAFDPSENRLLVLDADLNRIVAIGLAQGSGRSVLATLPSPVGPGAPAFPFSMALDTINNRALVTDAFQSTLTAVDLATGSPNVLVNGGNAVLQGVAIDIVNPTDAFFIDALSSSVFKASLNDPSVFSPSVVANGPPIVTPSRLAVNTNANPVVITDGSSVLVLESNGTLRELGRSDDTSANFAGVVIEFPHALLVEKRTASIQAVSLASGSIVPLMFGAGPNPFIFPEGLALDRSSALMFIADRLGAVVVVNTVNNQRVFY